MTNDDLLRMELDLGMGDEPVTEHAVRNAALGLLVEADVDADAETVTLHGPGGGNPVVAYVATYDDLVAIYRAYDPYATDQDADEYVKEYACPIRP